MTEKIDWKERAEWWRDQCFKEIDFHRGYVGGVQDVLKELRK